MVWRCWRSVPPVPLGRAFVQSHKEDNIGHCTSSIERCDHERASPAVDDWDEALDEVVGLDGQQIAIG
jgi:hypothetical protein